MFCLALAILSSTLVSTIMRLGEKKIRNNMGMFLTNYIICTALSLLFTKKQSILPAESGLGIAVGLGILSGILYLASFVLLQHSIRKNGVVLSATYMKLGILIPTLMAIFIFREQPKFIHICGIMLAIAAIIFMYYEKGNSGAGKTVLLLVVLLITNGITDSMANIYDKLGNVALKDHYLLFTFAAAGLCALALVFKKRQSLCRWDVLFGICIGLPNYFSSRFLLLALHQLPAVIVYPIYSAATIVAVSILGMLIFREKLSRKTIISISVIIIALILLNL